MGKKSGRGRLPSVAISKLERGLLVGIKENFGYPFERPSEVTQGL